MFSSPPALVYAAEIGFDVMKKKSLNQSKMSEKMVNGLNIPRVNSDAECNIHFSTITKSMLKIKLEKNL